MVIAIITVLIALLLPAVQAASEAARRTAATRTTTRIASRTTSRPTADTPGVVEALFCDGCTRFVKQTVNVLLWRALGSRNGQEVVSGDTS